MKITTFEGYGHFIEGAGSVVQTTTDVENVRRASQLKSRAVECQRGEWWGPEEAKVVGNLGLRYFTPREVANLLCFPPQFAWPDDLSNIQLYRCLGNSLSVAVVARLLRLMLNPGS